jgi:GNAT superfamily N-acetyltransferase
MPHDLTIRPATEADVPLILTLIRGLAEYEKLAHEVVATEELLHETLFGARRYAEVLIGDAPDEPGVCFAVFFHNFSTFLGRPGIYLEDLYVKPHMRGRGCGRALLARLAAIAKQRNCRHVEWVVLDWNESAIAFYRSLGARPNEGWTVFHVMGDALDALADGALSS